jgi:hypothetical protein
VLFPPLVTVGIFIIKRLKGTVTAIVKSVDSFQWEDAESADKLKAELAKNMDSDHKKIVRKLKHG